MDISIDITLNNVADGANVNAIAERLRAIAEGITQQETRIFVHDRNQPGRYDRLTLLRSLNRNIGVTGDTTGFDDNTDRINIIRE
jgi:hypothetical protein